MGAAQGKKLRAAPLQQGIKRRSHPLPTKAIHEAAYEGGFVSVRPNVIGKVRMFRSIGWLTIAVMKSRLCLQMDVASCAVGCRERVHRQCNGATSSVVRKSVPAAKPAH
jgi:hypothetical protein